MTKPKLAPISPKMTKTTKKVKPKKNSVLSDQILGLVLVGLILFIIIYSLVCLLR